MSANTSDGKYVTEQNHSVTYNTDVHPFRRPQVRKLRERLKGPPRFMVAIFGPRQAGKTTIVRQALEQTDIPSRYLAIDAPDWLGQNPSPPAVTAARGRPPTAGTERLVWEWRVARAEAESSGDGFVLVLDEIQKVPDWSNTVKGLWDSDRARNCPLRVALLGSAPLLLQSGLNETMAGRFLPMPVTHWTYREMEQAFGFSLDEYIYFGAYPGAAHLRGNLDEWRTYVLSSIVAPAVERDILAMVPVDKPALLGQLAETAFSYSGQIVSYRKMLGQLQDAGNATTLARYLDLLSRVGLVAGLSKYSRAPLRSRRSSPKLNVLNTALMTAGSTYSLEEARSDRSFWGRIVESAVGAHLLNTATPGIKVQYWRDGGFEVDFVLKGGPSLLGIEVKSGERVRDRTGMDEFSRRNPTANQLLVGGGGVPLDEFLSEPAERWLKGR